MTPNRRTEPKIRPTYYGGEDNPYEAIKVIQAWDLTFCLGNVVKYVRRAGRKDSVGLDDLRKARTYLEFEIRDREASLPTIAEVTGILHDA